MDRYDVLTLLRNTQDFCSGEEMARQLGVTRTTVWKWVKQLREEGYDIQSVTNRGYWLQGKEVLSHQELQDRLGSCALGAHMWVLPTVSSTNSFLKLKAEEGAPAGSVVVADCQEQGRGRRGRSFYSPAGEGLYISGLFQPNLQMQEVGLLTAAVALAVARAVEGCTGVQPQIKWPNDLVYQGKKLCGILTEASVESESGQVTSLVCGMGINVNNQSFPGEMAQQAVSLRQMAGHPLSRVELAIALLRELEQVFVQEPYCHDRTALLEQYRQQLAVLNRELLLLTPNGQEEVWGLDVDDLGGLVVRTREGKVRTLYQGDLSLRPGGTQGW